MRDYRLTCGMTCLQNCCDLLSICRPKNDRRNNLIFTPDACRAFGHLIAAKHTIGS
jgi:hypothetical protein